MKWTRFLVLALLGVLLLWGWQQGLASDRLVDHGCVRKDGMHFWVVTEVRVKTGLSTPLIMAGDKAKPIYRYATGAWCPDCGQTRVRP